MLIINLLLLVVYISLSIFGLMTLKSAPLGFNFPFIVGFSCYGAGFLIWLRILKTFDLSVAFPIASGLLIVGSQVAGIVFLHERLALYKELGVILIILGVLLIYANK